MGTFPGATPLKEVSFPPTGILTACKFSGRAGSSRTSSSMTECRWNEFCARNHSPLWRVRPRSRLHPTTRRLSCCPLAPTFFLFPHPRCFRSLGRAECPPQRSLVAFWGCALNEVLEGLALDGKAPLSAALRAGLPLHIQSRPHFTELGDDGTPVNRAARGGSCVVGDRLGVVISGLCWGRQSGSITSTDCLLWARIEPDNYSCTHHVFMECLLIAGLCSGLSLYISA